MEAQPSAAGSDILPELCKPTAVRGERRSSSGDTEDRQDQTGSAQDHAAAPQAGTGNHTQFVHYLQIRSPTMYGTRRTRE